MTKYFVALAFSCIVFAMQGQSSTEQLVINEVFRKVPLSKALKTIHEKYQVKIAYDNALVQNIVVALNLNSLSLSESFERLLGGTPLTYEKVGENFVIVPRPPEPAKQIEKVDLSVTGIIVDDETGETLPQAIINIKGTNIATTTNNDGHFSLLNVPSDTCSFIIQYLGYVSQTIRVKETDKQLVVRLKSDTKILDEVVVLDEYNQAIHIDEKASAAVFNPKSLASLPSLGEQDISRTLQLIPGVTATDESSSGMIIRGSHSSYNLTMLDGMTIYQQDHFFGAFSIINADIIKDVRVHKGLFDAQYGGRVSGVVDITTKNGNALKPAFNVKFNPINTKATVEIPLGKKWSLFAGARRSFTDVVKTDLYKSLFDIAQKSNDQIEIFRFANPLEGLSSPKYFFYDANAKLSYQPSDRDIVSLSLYVSRDNMRLSNSYGIDDGVDNFSIKSSEETRWGNNGISLRWGRQWNDRYYSNVRISDSKFFRKYRYYQEVDFDTVTTGYTFAFRNSITDLTYAADNEWLVRDNTTITWGVSGAYQQTGVRLHDRYIYIGVPPDDIPDNTPDTDVTRKDESWQHALYGSAEFRGIDRLTLTPGVRIVYYFNNTDQVFFEPRFSASYKINDQLNLKAGYGRNHQFISQLFYYSPTGSVSGLNENFWMLSDGDEYPVIESDHVSGGATLKQREYLFDAEVFYKISKGVIIDEDINSGQTNMLGLDFMIQKTSGIHKGWIAYSVGRAQQQHEEIEGGRSMPTWQDQRHELKIVDMLMLGNWNLSSTLVYGSGKPYPKYTVSFNRDEMGVIESYDLQLDYSNRSRLPAYFRIDLAASYFIPFKKKSGQMMIGLSVHNVTNHKNVKARRVNTEKLDEAIFSDTEVAPTYSDIVLLGFCPTVSIGISF